MRITRADPNGESDMKGCPICGGRLVYMGSMGWYVWHRCENCGTEVGDKTRHEDYGVETDDDNNEQGS